MTRSEYAKHAFDLYNSGKISEDAYDAMMINIDCFADDDEETWEAIDVYGNHYEFDNQEDAYNFCYNYIKEAIGNDPEEIRMALEEFNEYCEAKDIIAYRRKEEEDAE
jgi:hypothetical protein